jgi:hypothetical protein
MHIYAHVLRLTRRRAWRKNRGPGVHCRICNRAAGERDLGGMHAIHVRRAWQQPCSDNACSAANFGSFAIFIYTRHLISVRFHVHSILHSFFKQWSTYKFIQYYTLSSNNGPQTNPRREALHLSLASSGWSNICVGRGEVGWGIEGSGADMGRMFFS